MYFCTTINCMDGRVQLPVIEYLKKRFEVEYVDSITEPGPIGIMARNEDRGLIDNILLRVDISVQAHASQAIAVVGHHDCAGNPVDRDTQIRQVMTALEMLAERYPDVAIIGLWVDENWTVREL
ncbi:MAG: carbonic anhydrase [Candidatus Neomarinimicrobiota bacterium]